MSAGYQLRGAFDQQDYSPTPDELYWLLDNLGLDEPPWIVIESHEAAGRFIQALSVGKRRIDVEVREGRHVELFAFPAVDVLTAHQVILGCLSSGQNWAEIGSRITAEPETLSYDYSRSGLSVQVALFDHVERTKQLGVVTKPSPMINWGALLVAGGDIWPVSGPGQVTVVFEGSTPGQRHGISISSAQPALEFDGQAEVPEVILWPEDDRNEFVVHYDDLTDSLRITNVFLYGDGKAARVQRWVGNSALWVEIVSAQERVYHCNYSSTSPPTFNDLVCRLSLTESASA
ncbi:hypothetical protein Rhe02_59660 [Rhizocola hellebori]|uniref:Uncharacterized protein n=1 Tax=Rhizocola hellebori TaxID=1392758 RepID=A0A8J3VHY3_9ACTN|nr:hypothetical protein [Rhizocola hellebori]GIH07899.1 hypothetical protein Rhe02_59660 [Rhizocola hellebori]